MIYLIKGQERMMITDGSLEYNAPVLDLWIGDHKIGSMPNVSNTPLYFKLPLTEELLQSIPEGEYIMTLKEYGRVVKREMVKVWQEGSTSLSYNPSSNINIKQYGI